MFTVFRNLSENRNRSEVAENYERYADRGDRGL
jgi:hypothetical protein